MVALLRDMEDDFQTTDKESGDVHQEPATATEANSLQADTADKNDTSQAETEATYKQLKSILKKRGQYTFRKVKVDFDLIPTHIPYDENDYTIEIQIVEKEPIKIKSWAALFAAKKAEAAAEAAAAAEAEEALKKAEEVKRKEELKKAAKLAKKVTLTEDAIPNNEERESDVLGVTEDSINGNYIQITSSDHEITEGVVSDESENVNSEGHELSTEASSVASIMTSEAAQGNDGSGKVVLDLDVLSEIAVAEIDDIIDESLSQLSSVDDKLAESEESLIEEEYHPSEESLIQHNNIGKVDLIVSEQNDSTEECLTSIQDIPDEMLGTAEELLEDILAQNGIPLVLNGNVDHDEVAAQDEENHLDVHIEIERILGDAEAALEKMTPDGKTGAELIACQKNSTGPNSDQGLPSETIFEKEDSSLTEDVRLSSVKVAPELLDIAASVLDEIEKVTSLVISQVDTPV